jgi:hypothetical protein
MRISRSFVGTPVRFALLLALPLVLCGGTLAARDALQAPALQRPEPPMAGIHWARGVAGAARPSKSPNLISHGGPVMHGTVVAPIFWGTKWADPNFVGDKQAGIASFYKGVGGSSYAATNSEYTDASGHVSTAVTYSASYVDTSAAVSSGQRTAPILAEVCTVLGNQAVANGYYPVYVDAPRGHSGFCAWHSAGTCPNGVPVQFAFFYNLDGDGGCDPQDTSGQHSQGLAALANVSGHELSEMLTDPQLNAWYDSSGSENSDKCAWTFGTPVLTFRNNTLWKVQGNWSNAAFDSSLGYANSSGQRACLDGGNYR